MKRNELILKLRLDFNNYIRDNYLKDKCEECGSNENLHVHHIVTFISQFEHILELMNISSKEEFSDNEVELIRLAMFGSQCKNNHYMTLCQSCHINRHLELKYNSERRIKYNSERRIKYEREKSIRLREFIEYIRNNWTNKLIYTKDQKDEIISYAHDLGIRKTNKHKVTFNYLVTLMKESGIEVDKSTKYIDGKRHRVIKFSYSLN